MTRTLATIVIGLFLVGCGMHYWQGSGRGIGEFQIDSGQCIEEAKTKYEVSERIYRRCMRAQGWERIQTHYPSNSQFRGPEDEDEFFSPPNPLSARGDAIQGRADDPACMGPTVTRPSHCTRSAQSSDRAAARAVEGFVYLEFVFLDDRTSREPYASAERCEEQRRHYAAQAGVLWKQVRCVGPGPTQSTNQAPAKLNALIGTWSGTVYAQRATYPLTITFRDDGSWHATSPTLKPGTFDGAWRLNGSNVVWTSSTTGRTGTATLHEGNGTRILRMIPDDGTSSIELTPAK